MAVTVLRHEGSFAHACTRHGKSHPSLCGTDCWLAGSQAAGLVAQASGAMVWSAPAPADIDSCGIDSAGCPISLCLWGGQSAWLSSTCFLVPQNGGARLGLVTDLKVKARKNP